MLGEIVGTVRGTEAEMRQPMGTVTWDFRDGTIGGARFFQTWKEALDFPGLSREES